jgi:hypothetical protein
MQGRLSDANSAKEHGFALAGVLRFRILAFNFSDLDCLLLDVGLIAKLYSVKLQSKVT